MQWRWGADPVEHQGLHLGSAISRPGRCRAPTLNASYMTAPDLHDLVADGKVSVEVCDRDVDLAPVGPDAHDVPGVAVFDAATLTSL